MDCPECGTPLSHRAVAGVEVDTCNNCAGVWFDSGELKAFDEPDEGAGRELIDLPRVQQAHVNPEARHACPKDGTVMMRHFFSVKRNVEVDECPECGGYWLDAGELHEIRSEFPTEEARDQAAEVLLDEILGDDLLAARSESREELAGARRIANIFRFICPSYHLPGKQDGAAF